MKTFVQKLIKHHVLLILAAAMTVGVLRVPGTFVKTAILRYHEKFSSLIPWAGFEVSNTLLIIHICAAIPAILFGPLALYAPLRDRKPRFHRWVGTGYVFGCMVSAVTVFPLTFYNKGGIIGLLGFGAMACTWFTLAFLGYTSARNKDFTAHRRWMMRSYAMTFAFIHVNLTYKLLLPLEYFTIEGLQAFRGMVSWLFNLFLMELYLASTTHTGQLVTWKIFKKNATRRSPQDRAYFSI